MRYDERMKRLLNITLKWPIRWWRSGPSVRQSDESWARDPLSHPDISRMSERERADLQFRPECVRSE